METFKQTLYRAETDKHLSRTIEVRPEHSCFQVFQHTIYTKDAPLAREIGTVETGHAVERLFDTHEAAAKAALAYCCALLQDGWHEETQAEILR